MTRRFWVVIHRWAGLYIAFFVTVAGLTGSIMAFRFEIEPWIDPGRYHVADRAGSMLDPLTLRDHAQAREPRARFNYIPLYRKPGEVLELYPEARIDSATGKPYELGYSSLLLDPYTGAEIRRIKADLWPITRDNIMRIIVLLHYTLLLGDVGLWIFGIAAVIWTIDCFIGFYLTFPIRIRSEADASVAADRMGWWSRWAVSWKVLWNGPAYRVNLDLHRAGSLWIWPMLFVFAWTGVGFNLNSQVYTPAMKVLAGMKDHGDLPKLAEPRPDPALGWGEARAIGKRLMAHQSIAMGFTVEREQYLSYDATTGKFRYSVFSNRDVYRDYGDTAVLFNGVTGEWAATVLPSGQNAGATASNWMFALHMAAVGGLPMQIFVCTLGLVCTMLSVTGIYLWWKKRGVRRNRTAGTPVDLESSERNA